MNDSNDCHFDPTSPRWVWFAMIMMMMMTRMMIWCSDGEQSNYHRFDDKQNVCMVNLAIDWKLLSSRFTFSRACAGKKGCTEVSTFMDCYIICSLTSAYRHLYNTDNSVKRRLGSVTLVSVLKRFDCIYLITLILIGNQIDCFYVWGI